jgi:hypothetical protein
MGDRYGEAILLDGFSYMYWRRGFLRGRKSRLMATPNPLLAHLLLNLIPGIQSIGPLHLENLLYQA